MHRPDPDLRFAALTLALVVALLAMTSAIALAGPSPAGPTLDVTALQAKIDANGGSVHGYLKTVIKGSAVVTIPVDVLAVTAGFGSGPVDLSSLILFDATGPVIDKAGGIVAGMSGSPIFVSDGGVDKLVGALSYGDIFTKGGAGLATPIGAMTDIEGTYAAAAGTSLLLPEAVKVDGKTITRVVVPADPGAVKAAPAGTLVARPLNAVFLGGISPASRMYKAYAKVLASKGVDVVPLSGGLSSQESTFDAPFEGGGSIAALAARGDLWVGGIGTVTYTDGSTVLAFGHPAFWEGDTGLYLSNAWVDDIWPSALEPYKVARPATLRGTLTQDRSAGIMGVDGPKPVDVPVTAMATNLATGKVATSAVEIPRFVADSSSWNYYGIAAASAYVAGSRVFDAISNPGSAITTTTVTVNDGSHTYTVVRRNVYSEGADISMAVVSDVDEMVSEFQAANGNGIAHGHILSVHLETAFSPVRREATIVDVTVPNGGLKVGANTVAVKFLQYGNPATQTVNVPLTIPTGIPSSGVLTVKAINNPGYFDEYSSSLFSDTSYQDPSIPSVDRRTVKGVVDELNAEVDNTSLGVTFQPEYMDGATSDYNPFATTRLPIAPIVAKPVRTSWSISGALSKIAPQFDVYVAGFGGGGFAGGGYAVPMASSLLDGLAFSGPTFAPGQQALIYATADGLNGNGIVSLTGLGSGNTMLGIGGGPMYYRTPPLYKNTIVTATLLPSRSSLGVTRTLYIAVREKITPKWVHYSNPIAYDTKPLDTTRFSTQVEIPDAYASMWVDTPYGPVSIYKGGTGPADQTLFFPLWNGKGPHGERLSPGNYRWNLMLSKGGRTTTTVHGFMPISNVRFTLAGTGTGAAQTFDRYLVAGNANCYIAARSLTAVLVGPRGYWRMLDSFDFGAVKNRTVYLRPNKAPHRKGTYTFSVTAPVGAPWTMTVVQ